MQKYPDRFELQFTWLFLFTQWGVGTHYHCICSLFLYHDLLFATLKNFDIQFSSAVMCYI